MKMFGFALLMVVICMVATHFQSPVVGAVEQNVPDFTIGDVEAGSVSTDGQLATIIEADGALYQVQDCDQSRCDLRRERRAFRRATRFSACDRSSLCDSDFGSCASSFRVYEYSACDSGSSCDRGDDSGSCARGWPLYPMGSRIRRLR